MVLKNYKEVPVEAKDLKIGDVIKITEKFDHSYFSIGAIGTVTKLKKNDHPKRFHRFYVNFSQTGPWKQEGEWEENHENSWWVQYDLGDRVVKLIEADPVPSVAEGLPEVNRLWF